MAINDASFNTFGDADLPTTDTTVYTCPVSTVASILSCIFSNKTSDVVYVDVKIVRSDATTLVIVNDAPIPVGGALDIIANKPIMLEASDVLKAACVTGGASAVDVIGSVMETT